MGSMTNEEQNNIFLELLTYETYLKEEKVYIKIFISGFSVAFNEKIKFFEPRSLGEAIRNLKHCYEKSKCRSETKHDWKQNENTKSKWDKKRSRPQDIGNNENASPPKKFNAYDRGQGFQFEEKNKGDGMNPLQCWTCGKDHQRRDCPKYQGGRPQIYSSQEAHTVGVPQIIALIYASLDNREVTEEASIIEIHSKLCDQVFSILIEPSTNYTYVNIELVDTYAFNKEVHVESWKYISLQI